MPPEIPGAPQWHRTLAPLHNLTGPSEPIVLREGLAIQPFTKGDGETLVRRFGGWARGTHLSTAQVERWTHAVELRWDLAEDPTSGQSHAIETIGDMVRALRLHRAGVLGTTILWTRPELPDTPEETPVDGEGLSTPLGAGLYMHPLRYELESGDGPGLRKLFGALREVRKDKRLQLALGRFDAAYARYEHDDSLIDLWVALEALLTSTGRPVSNERLSLRIAWLTGVDKEGRRRAFELARRSYKARSAVVHGDEPPEALAQILDDTRELAREALRLWMLEPPQGGIKELDARLLA